MPPPPALPAPAEQGAERAQVPASCACTYLPCHCPGIWVRLPLSQQRPPPRCAPLTPRSIWTARTIGELRFDGKSRWQPIEATTVAAVQEPAFSYTGTLKVWRGPVRHCRWWVAFS